MNKIIFGMLAIIAIISSVQTVYAEYEYNPRPLNMQELAEAFDRYCPNCSPEYKQKFLSEIERKSQEVDLFMKQFEQKYFNKTNLNHP